MLNSMQIASLYAKIGADTREFDNKLRGSDNAMQGFGRRVGSTVAGVGKSMALMGAAMGAAVAAMVTKAGFKFNDLSQQGTIAFETMLGSADKAKAFMAELQTFAAKTPFEFASLMEASQKMLAMGFKENEILPTLTAIGDAVSALGGGQEKIDRVTIALGQLKAKGKTSAEEMMQLTEAGIPAWEMLAQAIGVSIPEAMEQVTKGAVSADTTIAAVVKGMQGRFGGLMSKQAEIFGGLRSNLMDTFRQVSGKVTKPLFDAVTRGMKSLAMFTSGPAFTAGVERFTARFGELVVKVEEWIKAHGPRMVESFKRVGQWIVETARDAVTMGQALADRFMPTIKGIANFIITTIPNAHKKFREIVDNVSDPGLMRMVVRLRGAFQGLGKTLLSLARPFKDAFGSLFTSLMQARGRGWSGIFDVLTQRLKKAVSEFGTVLNQQAVPFILEQLKALGSAMKGWIDSVDWWDKIKEWAGAFWGWAVGLWDLLKPYLEDFWGWLSGWVTNEEKRTTLWNAVVKGWDVFTEWAGKVWEWAKPKLEEFWAWLSGWITNEEKRTQLWNGIKGVWNWITEWAGKIWGWAEPGLTAGWNWLTSWFTDETKRAVLWNGIVAGWTWITDWAKKIGEWAGPHLAKAWNWLASWFTQPEKRKQLWQKIVDAWTWITDWAKSIWEWAKPKLEDMWTALTSWVTDETKRQELRQKVEDTWDGFTIWASGLWAKISPKLVELWGSLKDWIDTNIPNLGTWIDSFVNFAKDVQTQWEISFPNMRAEFQRFREKLETESPLIADAMGRLWKALFGEPEGGAGGGMVRILEGTFEAISRTLGTILTQVRILIDMLVTAIEATKALLSGDFQTYMDLVARRNALWDEFKGVTGDQWNWFREFWENGPGRATGGRATFGGMTWVGERGPELVNLPGGSHVYTNAQSMGMAGSQSLAITLDVRGESALPSDRSKIRELAAALQRELQLSGARVVTA